MRKGPKPLGVEVRFWKYVEETEKCWLWKGAVKPNGYGHFNWRASWKKPIQMGAHRASWIIHFGPIPEGMYVCHKCDVKNCVRPDHLFLGTAVDNMQDCVRKGRIASGDKLPQTKLNHQKARFIRGFVKKRGDQTRVSKLLNISRRAVSFVVNGKAWNDS